MNESEIFSRTPWQSVTDPRGSPDPTLRITDLDTLMMKSCANYEFFLNGVGVAATKHQVVQIVQSAPNFTGLIRVPTWRHLHDNVQSSSQRHRLATGNDMFYTLTYSSYRVDQIQKSYSFVHCAVWIRDTWLQRLMMSLVWTLLMMDPPVFLICLSPPSSSSSKCLVPD